MSLSFVADGRRFRDWSAGSVVETLDYHKTRPGSATELLRITWGESRSSRDRLAALDIRS
jgi:hypothetical protein